MNRTLLLLSLFVAAPVAVKAQAVVMPAAPLDAARTHVRDAMLALRDSLMTINGATAALHRCIDSLKAACIVDTVPMLSVDHLSQA